MGMTIFIKLAWRNILRNKRRTFFAGFAVGIGLAALIFTDALMIGMEANMVSSATASFLGEGQIHREGFRETFESELVINNIDSIIADLKAQPEVQAMTMRTLAMGMISSPANVSSVSMIGIDPATEPELSQIDEVLIEGDYFQTYGDRQVLIGRKMAELLEVGLGDRVVLTVAEAYTGDLAQEMFRVGGIFHFNVAEMDQRMAFVKLGKARTMMGLEGQAHQIVLKFVSRDIGRNKNHPIWDKYSRDGNEAVGWTVLLPQLEAAFEMSGYATLMIAVILFGVVALGIVNTLFMSLYERMFEFGVIRALGTRPFAMGRLVIFEAGALGLIAVTLGSLLGLVIVAITAHFGIDYGGIEFAGVTFRELLYPELQLSQFVIFPVSVLLFTMLIALYPAIFAARLTPSEAMRKSF